MEKLPFIFDTPLVADYKTQWQAPSNIALVKYWGKHGQQLPKNPSISFTLSQCVTTTSVHFSPRKAGAASFDFLFDQKKQPNFHPKIQQFLDRITPYFPALKQHHLAISSQKLLSPQQWYCFLRFGHGSLSTLYRRFRKTTPSSVG